MNFGYAAKTLIGDDAGTLLEGQESCSVNHDGHLNGFRQKGLTSQRSLAILPPFGAFWRFYENQRYESDDGSPG